MNVREIDVIWNTGFRHVLTAAGKKVLNNFSFIVRACRYLMYYMKDSCCFIDDYYSVIILSCVLRLVCPEFILKYWELQLNMILVTYVTQQKLSRMPCGLVL